MKNLVTKRRSGAISLLVALVMFAAGMLASIAPVHAAGAAFGKADFVPLNSEGTAGSIIYSHSFVGPVLFVTESSTHGAHNVTVPENGASEIFGPDWGHITVKYLDPTTNTFKPAGEYTVPTVPVDPEPTETPTETPPTPTPTPTETTPLPDDTDAPEKVWLCHATHPRAEAYVLLKVSVNVFLQAGHGQHEGDIVRPFSYVKQGLAAGYPGNRWTEEGIAIFNNGCTVPTVPVDPGPTSTPTETTTTSPSPSTTATATQSPSNTQSVTSTPSSSSTSVALPWTAEATPSESATAKASRYPAALVDTAVKGGDGRVNAPVLFGCAAIAALIGLLLIRSGTRESRRH